MQKSTRRRFLGQTGAASAMVLGTRLLRSTGHAARANPGVNDAIRIGVIGVGNRAQQLIDQVPAPGVVTALADCYLKRAHDAAEKRNRKWPIYQDYRQMLEKEELDAVIVATPDHVRTLPCLHAVRAGLDVYAEKPLTAYVREGRVLVDAVRNHQRIFQVGTQQRTMEINRFCCDFVRNGKIGAVKKVLGVNYPGPLPTEAFPEQPIPEGDDWDAWCGPTEKRPFHHDLQFGWMRWRSYSGGEMTNWGAHGIDQIQWALGKSHTGPVELWPESPGPQGALAMRYDDGTLVSFELQGAPMGGAIFVGSECKMEINRNRFATNPPDFVTDAPPPEVQDQWEGDGWIARGHIKNWLDCMVSRELPNADVEIGHRSVSVCHLLNITRELGRRLAWDPQAEKFVGDDDANALLDRPRRKGFEL